MSKPYARQAKRFIACKLCAGRAKLDGLCYQHITRLCVSPACAKRVRARGLCRTHWQREVRGQDVRSEPNPIAGRWLPSDGGLCGECGLNRKTKTGRRCLQCKNVRGRQALHGFTSALTSALYGSQGGKCAICARALAYTREDRSRTPLARDHDHMTGQPRGLLCMGCNSSLGWFERFLMDESRAPYIKYLADPPINGLSTKPHGEFAVVNFPDEHPISEAA